MDDQDRIRESVSKAYARTVSSDQRTGCCGSSCCGGNGTETAGIGAVNYSSSELKGLPPDAAAHSLGCGNPLAFSRVREGETVLDLGSGAGIDLLIAAGKVGPTGHVIGIDMTDEMIEKSKVNIASSGYKNAEVRKGIIEELPVEDRTIDWVISNCVVSLSPEKERVFAEIFRVLKPGGCFRISDILVEDLPEWLRENENLYTSCVAGGISEKDYLSGLRGAGLVEVEVIERVVYDASQLGAMAGADFFDFGEDAGGRGNAGSPTSTGEAVRAMEGEVWSAIITGRKPETE